jgi:hypothetical protein
LGGYQLHERLFSIPVIRVPKYERDPVFLQFVEFGRLENHMRGVGWAVEYVTGLCEFPAPLYVCIVEIH